MNFLPTFNRAALTLATLALGAVAHAETLTLTDDASTANKSPTVNAGTAETLTVSSKKGGKKTARAFLHFQLIDLPAGLAAANVARATLRLYVDGVTVDGTVQGFALTSDFAEDAVTDGTAPTLGAMPAGSFSVGGANLGGFVAVDITPAVRAAVQGGASTLGLALVANGDLNAAFDSKENLASSHPAGLDVIVTSFGPQGPQGAAGPQGVAGATGPQGTAGSNTTATTSTACGSGGGGGGFIGDGSSGAVSTNGTPAGNGNAGSLFSTVTTLPTAFY